MLKSNFLKNIVLLDIKRTAYRPIQSSNKEFELDDFLSYILRDLINNNTYDENQIESIVVGSTLVHKNQENYSSLRDNTSLSKYKKIHINSGKKTGFDTLLYGLQTLKSSNKNMILSGGGECFDPLSLITKKDFKTFLIKIAKAKTNLARLNILKFFNAKFWGNTSQFAMNHKTSEIFLYELKKESFFQKTNCIEEKKYTDSLLEKAKNTKKIRFLMMIS